MGTQLSMQDLLSLPIAVQTADFLGAILLGMALGALFDVLSCARTAFCGTRKGWIWAQDFLFVLVALAALFYYIAVLIGGRLRGWIYLGAGSGALLYFWTIGFFWRALWHMLFGTIHTCISAVLGALYGISKAIFGNCTKLKRGVTKNLSKFLKKSEKKTSNLSEKELQ